METEEINMKSDKQVQRDVLAELGWEPSVNAAHIGVEVSDGVVTLAGHVANYAEKLNAERAAQRVAGVKALAVEMDVTLAGDSKRTDSDIARAAENVLQWTTYLPPGSIKVKVENGWITLSGQVEWGYQRTTAVNAVRHLMGVTGVSEQIAIKPKVSSTLVKSDIEAAMKRRAQSHADGISVAVQGADVTLTGIVNSWSERQLAMDTAWGAPGVHNVVDKMSVTF
jgi:osmotically-inducible protein OsmY